jgi:hypothetical protein
MPDDDKREAVKMMATLSGQLVAAALAIIALGGGLTGYVLANRDVDSSFYVLAILTFVAFVLSIYFGGRGVSASSRSGYESKWDISASKSSYNTQAVSCIAGLILLFATAFFTGTPKTSDAMQQISKQNIEIGRLTQELRSLSKSNEELGKRVEEIYRKKSKVKQKNAPGKV